MAFTRTLNQELFVLSTVPRQSGVVLRDKHKQPQSAGGLVVREEVRAPLGNWRRLKTPSAFEAS
jgi:hypothetical protein